MGKRKKAAAGVQIREEIRKLNLIGKAEIRRSFDEEAASICSLDSDCQKFRKSAFCLCSNTDCSLEESGSPMKVNPSRRVDGSLACTWLNQKLLDLVRPESL